jgi:hypothetical protein|tara:strand:- start:73 stop:390 length:318 start_codon:yes stop_codon:yes gene_type:complete
VNKIVNLAYILTVLISIDLAATLFWVCGGLATEANPLMGYFLGLSPLLFVLTKLGSSFTGIYIFYIFRRRFRKIIFNALLGLNLVYIGVCCYHVWGMLFLLQQTN